ncbi:MAG: hypothetical protein JXB05_06155 [Myxococcaceae bacterium]|nr:hypothetical protein [Myxococcaceae bacterium]
MDARLTGGFLSLVAVLTAAGCLISQDELAGTSCQLDAECPESYACVGPEGQRFCEIIYPPRPAASDAGPTDAGVPPTYCADIKPVLDGYCTANCHGPLTNNSGQNDFRLDYYEPDAGQPKGAREMASRIRYRAFEIRTMPPANSPSPSDAQRALLGRWAAVGAPFCDGGTP